MAKIKAVVKAPAKKRTRTPDFDEWPEWSEAKFWSFIRSGLRSKWQRFPSRYAVLAAAKRKYEGPNKQQKWEYLCNSCGEYHLQKNVNVDHIESAGSLRSYDDLPAFVKRLFVGTEKLQLLCSVCHNRKTQEEKNKEQQ